MQSRNAASFVLAVSRHPAAGAPYAPLMREIITRFGRDNLGVLWLVAEPMIFTLGVATLWSTAGLAHGTSIPVVAFAVTGYSSVLMWRNAASHSSMAKAETNKALLYHRGVQAIDVVLTRIALESRRCHLLIHQCWHSVFTYMGSMPAAGIDLLLVTGRPWLTVWLWFGASLALLSWRRHGLLADSRALVDTGGAIYLFPMSGAAFMVDVAAHRASGAGSVPADGPRRRICCAKDTLATSCARTTTASVYMAQCCLVMTLAGLFLMREAARRVEL